MHLKWKCRKEDNSHLMDSPFSVKNRASLFFLMKEAFRIMRLQVQIQVSTIIHYRSLTLSFSPPSYSQYSENNKGSSADC